MTRLLPFERRFASSHTIPLANSLPTEKSVGVCTNCFGSAQSIADAQHGFLETGKRWPRLDTLMGVAEGLNISVDELLKGLHKPSRKRVSP